jgi:hypothetical protein
MESGQGVALSARRIGRLTSFWAKRPVVPARIVGKPLD